ncbi:MAG: hypothetical protein RR053_06100 [Evtepia sp.]
MTSLPDGVLRAARTYLDMTWDDPATDEKLSGILARGMTYLDHIAGVAQSYSTETNARALLFDYARYARANALQDFGKDFLCELNGLHVAGEVKQYEANTGIQ